MIRECVLNETCNSEKFQFYTGRKTCEPWNLDQFQGLSFIKRKNLGLISSSII